MVNTTPGEDQAMHQYKSANTENSNTVATTTLDVLKANIRILSDVEITDFPFVSCYLDLTAQNQTWRETLAAKSSLFRRSLKGSALIDFEECLVKISRWLEDNLLPTSKGVAIFARGRNGGSFFLPMQFSAPLPSLVSIYPTPSLYDLIALKDNYHSYVLLIAKNNWASISEVNLGEATVEAWIDNPDLFRQVGTEWSKLHYQINKSKRGEEYHDEKIRMIRNLMRENDLAHLIIAGDPEVIHSFRMAMPLDLKKKCVDVMPVLNSDKPEDIINATLASFIDYEEQESQEIADKLITQLKGQNLAVAGTIETFDALLWGEVDTLVITSQYDPEPGWRCLDCKQVGFDTPITNQCPKCGAQSIQPIDMKETILRLASQQDIPIEVVDHSDILLAAGGIGCLLRYKK